MRVIRSIFLIPVLIVSISMGVFASDFHFTQVWDTVPSSNLKLTEGDNNRFLFQPYFYCDFKIDAHDYTNHEFTANCNSKINTDACATCNDYKAFSDISVSENEANIHCWMPSYNQGNPSNGDWTGDSSSIRCTDSGFTGTSFTLTVTNEISVWDHGSGDGAYTIINRNHYETKTKDFTIQFTSVNDAPTSSAITIEVDRGTSHTFQTADFPYSDDDTTTFTKLNIHNYNGDVGDLKYNGYTWSGWKEISSSDIEKLTWVPIAMTTGGVSEYIGLFKLYDGNLWTFSNSMYANIHYTATTLSFSELPDYEWAEDFSGTLPYGGSSNTFLLLNPYCPDGENFKIISETNPDIINCIIDEFYTSSGFKSEFRCTSVTDGFGINVITIECNEGDSDSVTKNINIDIANSPDPITIYPDEIFTTVLEGSTKYIVLPISNPDRITDLEITTKISPEKTLTPIEYEYVEESATYSAKYVPYGSITGPDTFTYHFYDDVVERVGTVQIDISNVNDIPISMDNSIDMSEDKTYSFKEIDFPFTDPGDEQPFDSVRILSYPNKGVLKKGIVPITLYQSIPKSQISGINYVPEEDGYGNDYARFLFSVSDGVSNSESHILSINVKAENDPPTIEFIPNKNIPEDSKLYRIFIRTDDVDEDVLEYTITSKDQLVVKNSNIQLSGSGNNPIILITLEEDISDRTTTITVLISDGTDYDSETFDIYVTPVNDPPFSENFEKSAYVYDIIEFTQSDFTFSDIDGLESAFGKFIELEIINSPSSGELKLNDEVIPGTRIIPYDQIDKLSFELPEGLVGNELFTFRVSDGMEYSEVYEATLNILPSLYGLNSQPASFGGFPIYNTGWACKPGYQIKSSLSTLALILETSTEVCEESENIPPIANISISVEEAELNTIIYFSGAGSVDPDGSISEYAWILAPTQSAVGAEQVNHSYSSLDECPAGICTIQLTVTDDQGDSDIATAQLRLVSESNETAPDYSDIVAIEGNSYTDGELAHLGLVSGQTRIRGGNEITVDSSGKITQIVKYEGDSQSRESYMEGDGICSESLGEHSLNSADDCKGKSKMGAVLLLAFLTILGGGAFFAWKKGLLGKHNLSLGAKPTADASPFETTQPIQPEQSSGPESYIKTQRTKGFSNEQIRGALKNKGWSDDKIDEALNASRE